MPWNPEQYHKFQAERSAPFFDLLNLVKIRPNLKVIDLGCGTGELTRRLVDSLPNCEAVGLDQSEEMLRKASAHAGENLRFERGDQTQIEGAWDLIFSNAALQWSEDHRKLIPSLFGRLNEKGQLAVQVPSNHNHISQRILRETAGEEPFYSALNGFNRQPPVLPIDEYAEILFHCGAEEITVFEKIYPHVLENSEAVLEWIKGTALVPYLERLDSEKDAFLNVIRKKLSSALPGSPILYPFRRTFISAVKPRG
jgi:trans-aconitate 2-methyltransferase